MPDELLGPLFDDLRLHQRSEGSHDAAKEMAATSQVAPRKTEAWLGFETAAEPAVSPQLQCAPHSLGELIRSIGPARQILSPKRGIIPDNIPI